MRHVLFVQLVVQLALVALVGLPGCRDSTPQPPGAVDPTTHSAEHPHLHPPGTKPHAHDEQAEEQGHAHPHYGPEQHVGFVSLAGYRMSVTLGGQLAPGAEAAVTVEVISALEGLDCREAGVYVWAESEGKRASRPARLRADGETLRGPVAVTAGTAAPTSLVIRVRQNGRDARERLPVSTSPAVPTEGPHGGLIARAGTSDGEPAVWVELKLHDDLGDIEIWLARDRAMEAPLDLPLEAALTLAFESPERTVTLRPRNQDLNEDEAGTPNVRDGQTNYFIFPGDSGEDATWLRGAEFRAAVTLSFPVGPRTIVTRDVLLRPHGHRQDDGHGHEHEGHGHAH